jgi:hypothetical protein
VNPAAISALMRLMIGSAFFYSVFPVSVILIFHLRLSTRSGVLPTRCFVSSLSINPVTVEFIILRRLPRPFMDLCPDKSKNNMPVCAGVIWTPFFYTRLQSGFSTHTELTG